MAGRRVALYFAWDRPQETCAPLERLNDRYPALFELRRALWPLADGLAQVQDQGIDGFLEDVVLSDFARFRALGQQLTGHEVQLHERRGNAGNFLPLNGWIDEIDTLIIVSLDHLPTGQVASDAELAAVNAFLAKDGRCAFICLHHDVGTTSDPPAELAHHGDRLVPGRQQIGGFGRSVLAGLGLQIENRHGFRPARAPDGRPAELEILPEFAGHPLLAGVETFNLHPHLPDLQIGSDSRAKVDVLARQQIAADAPLHPAAQPGQVMFNALLQVRPESGLGRLFVCDATLWSSAFGGEPSLLAFWQNVVTMD